VCGVGEEEREDVPREVGSGGAEAEICGLHFSYLLAAAIAITVLLCSLTCSLFKLSSVV
jgi:hypothetical protein